MDATASTMKPGQPPRLPHVFHSMLPTGTGRHPPGDYLHLQLEPAAEVSHQSPQGAPPLNKPLPRQHPRILFTTDTNASQPRGPPVPHATPTPRPSPSCWRFTSGTALPPLCLQHPKTHSPGRLVPLRGPPPPCMRRSSSLLLPEGETPFILRHPTMGILHLFG